MILDGHIHLTVLQGNSKVFRQRLAEGDACGGIVISPSPSSFRHASEAISAEARLAAVLEWTAGVEHLYPFFWIDPLESDAMKQAERALVQGIKGFKIICNRYFPYDPQVISVCTAAAEAGKPVMFHSGILWDGAPSSKYNRPADFESLLFISKLRFSMAHISWPWCDEMIAVYGKFQAMRRRNLELNSELFIDTTPGTPDIYRDDTLRKLFTVGYRVQDNVFFGTDNIAEEYDSDCFRQFVERDNKIMTNLGLDEITKNKYFANNLLRFLGA